MKRYALMAVADFLAIAGCLYTISMGPTTWFDFVLGLASLWLFWCLGKDVRMAIELSKSEA